MSRNVLFALCLIAPISTAFAAEPAAKAEAPKTQLHVPPGGALVRNEDGSIMILSAEAVAKEAEANAILAKAEAEFTNAEAAHIRSQTVAQPYTEREVHDETKSPFGGTTVFSTQPTSTVAVAGSKARKAKLEVIADANNRGAEIAVSQTRANAEFLLAQAIAEGKLTTPITTVTPDGGFSTGDAANTRAWTANGIGFGNPGFAGAGLSYGASPFQTVQRNGVGWQAVAAGQNAPVTMQMPVDPNSKQLQTTATATTTVTTTATSAPAGVPPLPPPGQVADGQGGFRPMTDAEKAKLAAMKAEQARKAAGGQ